MTSHNTPLSLHKPRRITFFNVTYKHAVLTKVSLFLSILLVAAWFILFSELSLGLTNNDGDLLPLRTGQPIEERTNLSVHVLAEPNPNANDTDRRRIDHRVSEVRESTENEKEIEPPSGRTAPQSIISSRGAQNSLASRLNAGNEVREIKNPACLPSQNLQQERTGDTLRTNAHADDIRTGNAQSIIHKEVLVRSSSAFVQSVERSACPQSKPPPNGSEYPKLSVADTYVRLLEVPRYFSIEPPKLKGNRFR